MNLKVESSDLNKALKTAGRIVPTKAIIPILECFHIEVKDGKMTITASNSEITVKVPVTVTESKEDCAIAIAAKKFSEHIGLLPDCTVSLKTEGTVLHICWDKGKTSMQTLDANDFPSTENLELTQTMDIPAQELKAVLSRTIPVCAKGDLRPILSGVHFDILEKQTRIVATDAHTLIYETIECSTGNPVAFTIPSDAASIINSAIKKETQTAKMSCNEKNACFNLDDVTILSRNIDGKYPAYMTVIPSAESAKGKAVTSRENLTDSVRRVAACSEKIKISFGPNALNLTAENLETGSNANEDCECKYDGEPIVMGVNAKHMLLVLENTEDDNLNIEVSDPSRAFVITGEKGREVGLSLLMPILIDTAS